MSPTGAYIEANGLRFYYEAYGEGDPLVLIHGGQGARHGWAAGVRRGRPAPRLPSGQ